MFYTIKVSRWTLLYSSLSCWLPNSYNFLTFTLKLISSSCCSLYDFKEFPAIQRVFNYISLYNATSFNGFCQITSTNCCRHIYCVLFIYNRLFYICFIIGELIKPLLFRTWLDYFFTLIERGKPFRVIIIVLLLYSYFKDSRWRYSHTCMNSHFNI